MTPSQIRKHFAWFDNHSDLIYFDNGATSLKPKSVLKAINDYYQNDTYNPHNDTTSYTSHVGKKIKEIRQMTADLLSCKANEIIFTPGSTQGLNQVAFGIIPLLQPGDEILVPEYEHASNLLPWLRVAKITNTKFISVKQGEHLEFEQQILKAVSKKTRVVSFTSASNLFGTAIDAMELARKIKVKNPKCFVCVDATQSVQHNKINLKKGYIDFLAFSTHKVFGPTGLGVVYLKENIQSKMNPLIYGGGTYRSFDVNTGEIDLVEGPTGFEAGTPNVAGIFGWGAAVEFINSISYREIHRIENELKNYLVKKLRTIKGINLLDAQVENPTVVFNYKNVSPQDLAYYLGTKKIIVRGGTSCVYLARKRSESPQGYVRVSMMFYNTKKEVDKLVKALREFKVGDSLVGLI
ncbi:aminotransferase class V-fold PLP-dependent enzyme [[Mycoplasma] testudinis]|uniref:aminotransferase class V-fold PLP-dependent enzyme n=1 Tax=[Mycoplasma] testudinis TaxID=33924 RepID=UPI000482F9C0|nr:aminotransferase class V-fold PLP-dependent enzyme [[Mycoplasma] testudinis]